jgi:dCTP diphosphatase
LDNINVNELKQKLKTFAKDRDWEKFHNPKNLSMALSVEIAELVEIFQWMTAEESIEVKLNKNLINDIAYELADIISYVILIADIFKININNSIIRKIEVNNVKYPINKVKGSSKKYNQY